MKLIIEDDEGRKTVVPIVREDVEITIGRQEGNTIRLTERNISRKHAKLIRRNGSVVVEDLGSYNGVKINGDRITGSSEVKEGDLVQIGDYDLAIQTEEGVRPAANADGASATEDEGALEATSPGSEPPAEVDADEIEPADAPVPATARRESTAIISNAQLKANRTSRKVTDIPAEEAPRLLVMGGEFAGREYACIRSEIKIGRTEDNDIAIDHRSLSRNHCKVVREDDGEWKVIDLQSSNGVKVNGEQYAASALHPGDVLELGHIKFKFLAPGDDATEATTAVGRAGRSRMPLIAGAVVGLAALGVGGYLLVLRKPAATVTVTEPVTPKTPDKPDKPQTPVANPTPNSGATAAVDPTATKEPEKTPAPELPPPDPQAVKALEAGKQLLAAGKFAEAEKKFAAAKDGDVEGAAELLAQARAEIEAQDHVTAAQKKLAAKDLEGARLEATAVPPDSALSEKARDVERQIDAAQEKLDRERQTADARAKADEEKRVKAEQAKLAAEQAKKAAEQAKADQAKQAKAAAEQAKAAAEQAKANAATPAKESPAQQAAADLATGKNLASNSQKKYKEAIPYLERALKADASLAEAHLYLGTCYARLEDIKRGAFHYEEFVHLRPNDSQAPKVRQILREYFRQSGERPRWPLPEE